MNPKKIPINADRLWTDLKTLAEIGADPDGGLTRIALSDADQEAHAFLMSRMRDAGLKVDVDDAFNVIGTLPAKNPGNGRKAIIGSHLDTVPNGGKYDGALGVLSALECARTIQENDIALPWDLEVISFCDEEGGHHAGTIGSRAMTGALDPEEIQRPRPDGGPSFSENLERAGGDPSRIQNAVRPLSDVAFFLEIHIEQGRVLESRRADIGVVTAIAGIQRTEAIVLGEAAHSGTTPMKLRKDALVAAAPLFTLLPKWAASRNPEMTATIGRVRVSPGAVNVVPGECRFTVELRSQNAGDMKAVQDLLDRHAARQSNWRLRPLYRKDPVRLSTPLQDRITLAALREGLYVRNLPSGAGHDAASFAPHVPTGMIFVPCRGGVSHHPDESITPVQAAHGCQVLLRTLIVLAGDAGRFLSESERDKGEPNPPGPPSLGGKGEAGTSEASVAARL